MLDCRPDIIQTPPDLNPICMEDWDMGESFLAIDCSTVFGGVLVASTKLHAYHIIGRTEGLQSSVLFMPGEEQCLQRDIRRCGGRE